MNINKSKVNLYKRNYPAGTKLELINMDDPYRNMPAGLKGEVIFVDDACQIHCNWENGSSLALIPGVDSFSIVKEKEQSAEVNKQHSSNLDSSEDSIYSLDKMKEVLGDDYGFRQTKSVDEIKQILKSDDVPLDNVPFVLEVGNLDIEITIYGDDEHKHPWLGYYCCIREDGEWRSYAEIDTEVDIDVPDLEAEMFRVLSEYADEHNLSFFCQNRESQENIHDEKEDNLER